MTRARYCLLLPVFLLPLVLLLFGGCGENGGDDSPTVPEPPEISMLAFPPSMSLGRVNSDSVFTLHNQSDVGVDWIAVNEAEWVSLSASLGHIPAQRDLNLKLYLHRDLAPLGITETSIQFEVDGQPRTELDVFVHNLPPPFPDDPLELSSDDLSFTGSRDLQPIRFRNVSDEPLTWTIANDEDWLTFSTDEGALPAGEMATVLAHVSRDGLREGVYRDTVQVAVNGAPYGHVPVFTDVGMFGGGIEIGPGILDFGAEGGIRHITWTSRAGIDVGWTMGSECDYACEWIVHPSGGTLAAGQSGEIEVRVTRMGFPPGEYHGVLTIFTTNGPDLGHVNVIMTVP